MAERSWSEVWTEIRVSSVNPGMVETEGAHAAGFIGSDFQTQFETQTPLGRIGQPDASRRLLFSWRPRIQAR
jgi:NAD(P)-dependent dehydrogenase (short-subunit alcohol dehydrogenase family)